MCEAAGVERSSAGAGAGAGARGFKCAAMLLLPLVLAAPGHAAADVHLNWVSHDGGGWSIRYYDGHEFLRPVDD